MRSATAKARLHDIEPVATGVVVPGVIDEASGTVVASANLGRQQVPMISLLQGRSELPVVVGHGVRAAGLAEAAWGAARGKADAVFVAVGTGVAAALTVASQPYSGGGFAGEIGHLPIAGHSQPCGCGGTGCLETVASAAAIASRFNEPDHQKRTFRDRSRRAGSPWQRDSGRTWGEAIDALGSALAVCIRLIAPEMVVIGGGLAAAGDQLLHPLRDSVDGAVQFNRPFEIRMASRCSARERTRHPETHRGRCAYPRRCHGLGIRVCWRWSQSPCNRRRGRPLGYATVSASPVRPHFGLPKTP